MPRGNWRVIFAIVGVAFLGALLTVGYSLYDSGQQHHANYRYQPASKSLLGAGGLTPSPTKPYQPYCQNPESREDADLCAQWAAVDQVSESNRLASVNTRLATLTLLLTVLGTLLLVWTFDETRETARRELRAYVVPKHIKLAISGHKPDEIGAAVELQNAGETPATDLTCALYISVFPGSNLQEVEDKELTTPKSAVILTKGETKFINHSTPIIDPNGRRAAPLEILHGDFIVFVHGWLRYKDVFGRSHETRYRYFRNNTVPPDDMGVLAAPSGNTMT